MARAQKVLFAIVTIAIAATRFPALSLTLHDWDETLFAWGVRAYDVVPHHPHPPGYPLFIVLGKFARPFTDTDFHALQAVATLASMLVFPAAFALARALKFRLAFAYAAAALTALLPPVWYYGGTALSDVPALVLILFSCALLLSGARDSRLYFAGAILTAAACCIRPQIVLVAAVPALVAAMQLRRAKTIGLAWTTAATIVLLAYFAAAMASSNPPRGYLEEARKIRDHIEVTASYHNRYRTPLRELAPRVFLFPCGGGRMKFALLVLAGIALIDAIARRRAAIAMLIAMFLPIAIFTWLMLDPTAFTRYAVAYVALYAFLAVAGIEAFTRWLPPRIEAPVSIALAAFLTFSFAKWTWPALRFARTEPSPAVAVFQWIRENVPREGPTVYVDNNLIDHAAYLIPDYHYKLVWEESALTDADFAPGNVLILEGDDSHQPELRRFTRKRLQLWEIARPRYFEIEVLPMHRMIRYGEGWYAWEGDAANHWRWMSARSETRLPLFAGRGVLRMRMHAPIDATPRPPNIVLTWNGTVIDRIRTNQSDLELVYTLESRRQGANQLRITTDETITPRNDRRPLGLRVWGLSWSEASASALQ